MLRETIISKTPKSDGDAHERSNGSWQRLRGLRSCSPFITPRVLSTPAEGELLAGEGSQRVERRKVSDVLQDIEFILNFKHRLVFTSAILHVIVGTLLEYSGILFI